MKYLHIKSALTILLALCLPGLALAWGKDGHETVGYLAATMIAGSNTEKKVNALLE